MLFEENLPAGDQERATNGWGPWTLKTGCCPERLPCSSRRNSTENTCPSYSNPRLSDRTFHQRSSRKDVQAEGLLRRQRRCASHGASLSQYHVVSAGDRTGRAIPVDCP